MKNLLKFSALITLLMAFSSQTFAVYNEAWEIKSFDSEITIHENRTVQVTEKILADFTNEQHHGIARSIPNQYENGYDANIDFQTATDENGASWSTKVENTNGYLDIQMTTPDGSYLRTTGTFIVNYLAKNVITFFDETKAKKENTFPHDEFYWNVNGTEWPVKTGKITAIVHLPKAIPEEQLNVKCITGAYGATGQDCEYKIVDRQTISFKTTRPFEVGENLTIVIGMPVGTITPPPPPSIFEIIFGALYAGLGIIFALGTLIFMYRAWKKNGRDDQSVRSTIMPHYEPPKGLLPAESGTLIDEKMDPNDITSTIIDYAVKGYIRINEIEEKILFITSKDYELELLKPYKTEKEFEEIILDKIFIGNKAGSKRKISELKDSFYVAIPNIEKAIMSQLVTDEYFPESPSTTRKKYMTVGGIMIGIGASIGQILIVISPTFPIGLIVSGIIIMIFGSKMPRKTRKGTEAYYQLKGLYEYINTAEKDRMKFQEDNNIMFEKLLPYAMAFGIVGKWAKAFDGLITNPPSWYHTSNNHFTMIYLADSLSHWNKDLAQNLASRPGSKGGNGGWSGGSGFSGGFSGGGFGGGGGRGL